MARGAREAVGLQKRFGEIGERGPIKLFNAIRAAQKVRKWAGFSTASGLCGLRTGKRKS